MPQIYQKKLTTIRISFHNEISSLFVFFPKKHCLALSQPSFEFWWNHHDMCNIVFAEIKDYVIGFLSTATGRLVVEGIVIRMKEQR